MTEMTKSRPNLAIDPDGLRRLRELHPDLATDKSLAERLGLSVPTVNRVLRGVYAPGPHFLASVREVLGTQWFIDLFQVVDDCTPQDGRQ